MSMIYDKLNINVVDGSVSILPDFYQTTQNSHCLLIHLRKGCDKRNFFKIDGLTPEIHFTNAQGEEVVSEAVNIDNPYRGDLSYVIGPAMLADQNRYIVSLVLNNTDGEKIYKFQFIVNVVKDYNKPQEDSDVEVTIKKSEKKQWEEAVEEALALEGRVEDLEQGNTKVLYPNPGDPSSPVEFNIPSTDDSLESELDFTQFTTVPKVQNLIEEATVWEQGSGLNSIQTKDTSCEARGDYSTAEGQGTLAESDYSHAEGWVTRTVIDDEDPDTRGHASHAEGSHTIARGAASHAEGNSSESKGWYSHAEGAGTLSGGVASHTEGDGTVTNNLAEHAQGRHNKSTPSSDNEGNGTLHSIGIGTSLSNRKNAEETMENGDKYIIGVGGFNGTNSDEADTVQNVINGKVDTDDIVDNAESEDPNVPLSANMGRELNQRIDNLASRGRFLSTWDCTTGLADTLPTTDPYEYKPGDYFIVSTIATEEGQVNYRPFGTEYSVSTPSTDVETEEVKPNDDYWFDGTVWILQKNTIPELVYDDELSDTSENAVQNKVIKEYLDENYSKDLKGEIVNIYFDPTVEVSGDGLSSSSPVKTSQEVWDIVNQYNGDFVIVGANTSKSKPLRLPDNLSNKNIRFNYTTIELYTQCQLSNSNIFIGHESTLFRTEPTSIGCIGDCSITLGYKATIEDTAGTQSDTDCMILGETRTPNSNEMSTNITFTTQTPNNYIYSNSKCLISSYGNGSVVCNIDDCTEGAIKTLCEACQYYSCIINVFGNPSIEKDSWTTDDKYAVINYANTQGVIHIQVKAYTDYDWRIYPSDVLECPYTYQDILDYAKRGHLIYATLLCVQGSDYYEDGPFILESSYYDKNGSSVSNLVFIQRSGNYPQYDYATSDNYTAILYVNKSNEEWHYKVTKNCAYYAQRIGMNGLNHQQIGATNRPVYVNSDGQIVAGDTLNNGTTYLYRRDGNNTTRYVGAWTANAAGTSTLYLDEYDLNGGYVTIYIDSVNGNDNNTGISYNSQIKTWSKLVELINRYYNGAISVNVSNDISVSGRTEFNNKSIRFSGGSLTVSSDVTFTNCSVKFWEGISLIRGSSKGFLSFELSTFLYFGDGARIASNIAPSTGNSDLFIRFFEDCSAEVNLATNVTVDNGSNGPYAGGGVFHSFDGNVKINIANSLTAHNFNLSDSLLVVPTHNWGYPCEIILSGYENYKGIKLKHWAIDYDGNPPKSCKVEYLSRDLEGGTANVYINGNLTDDDADRNDGLTSSTAVKSWWKLLEILQTYKNGKVIVNITGTLDFNIANQNVQLDNVDLEFIGNVTVSMKTYFHNMNIIYHDGTWLGKSPCYFENCNNCFYKCTVDDNGLTSGEPILRMIGNTRLSFGYPGNSYSCELISTNENGLIAPYGDCVGSVDLLRVYGTVVCVADCGWSDNSYGPVIYVYNDSQLTKTKYCNPDDTYGTIIYKGTHASVPQVTNNNDLLVGENGEWTAKSGLVDKIQSAIQPTDYATTDVGGVFKPSIYYATQVVNGTLTSFQRTKAQYDEASLGMFISKGTLENLKTAGYLTDEAYVNNAIQTAIGDAIGGAY